MINDIQVKRNFASCAAATVMAAIFAVALPLAAETPTASGTQPATDQAAPSTQPAGDSGIDRIAHIRLDGRIIQSPPDFTLFADSSSYMTVRDWLKRLADARQDDNLSAVALEIHNPLMTWSQAVEIADAVRRLDEVTPVYTFLTDAGPAEYLVASAGRKIMMEPAGSLNIVGVGGEVMFFRGALDWLGIKAQMLQMGRFKGAAEPFTRRQPSGEFRGELSKVIDDLYNQMCGQIAGNRGMELDLVKRIIDRGPFTAQRAENFGLVDGLVETLRWRREVNNLIGSEETKPTWLDDYAKKRSRQVDVSNPFALMSYILKGRPEGKIRKPTVAFIHADGVIVSGKSGTGFFGNRMAGAETIVRCFKEMRDDDRVKAVIFRINSPGGSAIASELIYQAVKSCDEKKPVIASISQTGASGGYYIAAGARKIMADKSALVGSIGVVGGKMAMTGLYEKLRIGTWRYTRGKNAGIWMSDEWSKSERAALEKMLRSTYDRFVGRVKESRRGKIEDLNSVVAGRIFTARQAHKNGLVDALGGIRQAVAAAHEVAGLEKSYFITRPKPRTLADLLFGSNASDGAGGASELIRANSSPTIRSVQRLLGRRQGAAYLLTLAEILSGERILTAVPYHLSVNR